MLSACLRWTKQSRWRCGPNRNSLCCYSRSPLFAQDLPLVRGTVPGSAPRRPALSSGPTSFSTSSKHRRRVYSRVEVARVHRRPRRFSIRPERPGTYFIEARKATYLTAEDLDAFTPLPCCFVTESPLVIEAGGSRLKNFASLWSAGSPQRSRHRRQGQACRGTHAFHHGRRAKHECLDRQGWRVHVLGRPAGSDKVRVAPDRAAYPLAIRVKRISRWLRRTLRPATGPAARRTRSSLCRSP